MGRATQWLEKHSASGDAMASGTGRASMWLKEHRESSAAMTASAVKTKAKAPATTQKHISRPTEQAPAATEPPAVTARAAPPVNPDYAPLAEVQKSQRPMAKKNPVEARSSSEKWEAPAPGEKVLKARPSAVQKATIKRVDLVVRPHKEEPIPVGPASQNRPSGGEIMIPRRPENNVQDDYASLRELGRSYYMPGVGRTINRGQGAEQRAWNTVSGAAKLSAGGIAGLGGLIAENLEALDRMAARSTTNGQRAIQEEENIRRYRSMLENGTWADGKPLSTEDRYQVLGYIQDAQDFIKLNNDYLDNIHAPIRQVQEAAYDTAGRWTESGQRDVDMAKEDLGDLGEFAVDVGVAGTQMGLDFAPAILTGGSALVPMFLRSAGGAALAGKDSGADLGTRTAYALGSGALSVLTEQISNAPDFLKGMYGEGLAERIFSHMAARYGQSAAVRAAARLASSPGGHVALAAFGEGLEELAESFFQVPLQQATIDPDAQFDPVKARYEFLLGAALGGVGGGVDALWWEMNPNGGIQDATIKHPYHGPTPVQEQKETAPVVINHDSVQRKQNLIKTAMALTDSPVSGGQNFRSILRGFLRSSFQPVKGIEVKGVTFDGKPYLVDINSSVLGKVISDINMSAKKLSLLNVLPEIVQNGKYIGSSEYIPHGAKIKNTIRFDYFETLAVIDEEEYTVKFDVEVFPAQINYRTHQVTRIRLYPTTWREKKQSEWREKKRFH